MQAANNAGPKEEKKPGQKSEKPMRAFIFLKIPS